MTTFVLDASVAAKWMLPARAEAFRAEAYHLLDSYELGDVEFTVPDVFWAECGNIVWKAVRQQRFSRSDAEFVLDSMLKREIITVSSATLLPKAVSYAFDFGCAVYDALYLALAVQEKTQLITADERLANAVAAYLPVKWLGSI